jgi:hypothetical protein
VASALSIARLFSDALGESHVAAVNVELVTRDFAPPAPSFDVADFAAATRYGFLRVPSGWVGDLPLEDTTGKGRRSRVIGDVPVLLAVVQV